MMIGAPPNDPIWHVYMLECADNSLYTGITTDVTRRLAEHNSQSRKAAKYTRARQPVRLVYQERAANRSAACQREAQIKTWSTHQKRAFIAAAFSDNE